MRTVILLAGVAAIAAATPAFAKPDHAGKSKATTQSNYRYDANRNGIPDYRERMRADANFNGVLDYRERRTVDLNRNGVPDYRERFIDRDRDGIDDRREASNRYGANACPPGLAKKNNGCLPPGQAKKQFNVGQRIPNGYNYYTDYNRLPSEYYSRYDLDNDYRYIRRNDYLYEVDPLTSLVRRVIGI